MNLFDSIKVPVGVFDLRAFDASSGSLVQHVTGENIVVNDGREALARLLGNDPGDWYVDTMKFGDGGHTAGTPPGLETVDVTDTDLYGTIHISKDVTGAGTTWPATRKVTFTATVEAAEGNGAGSLEYSEAGLYYNAGASMFAHKAFGYIVKNATIRLVATWTFVF
jgi:hypothetical protein